jgi:putative endonuclease
MHYVYIIQSLDGRHWYVGVTNNIQRRLIEHNTGHSIHTTKYQKWNLQTYIAFTERQKAEEFEEYLKSHSGRAFTKKHF